MHTPLWIKIGMALGFSYLGLFSINLVGDLLGGPGSASTEHLADAADTGHTAQPEPTGHQAGIDPMGHGADGMPDGHATDTIVVALVGDAAAGAKTAKKKCMTCHTVGSSDKHRTGPNLHGVIVRGRGTAEGYNYSAGLKTIGGAWSDVDLDAFLADPKAFVKGTKMSLKTRKDQERADVIAYLKTLQ